MTDIIFIAVLAAAAVIGILTGLIKGYLKTSFWGATVLLGVLFGKLIGGMMGKSSAAYPYVTLGVSLAALILFSLLFQLARKFINMKITARRTLSEYQNRDKLDENDSYILDAVDRKDKKAYKKYRKARKKIKTKSGAWGVVNRVIGPVFGALNWFVAAFMCLSFVALFADLSQISAFADVFKGLLESEMWVNMFSAIAIDVMVMSVISFALRAGYKGGLSSVLSTLIILGLIVAFGYASYGLAVSPSMSGMIDALESNLPNLPGLGHTLAVIVATAIFFLLSLVVIIIVAIFLPRFINKFKENSVFSVCDGVLGALVFTVFIVALMLVFGGVAASLSELPVMEKLNHYMEISALSDCFYACNPLADAFASLPLMDLFKAKN